MSWAINLNDYTNVAMRIKLFWEKFPDGAIRTMLILNEANVFIFRCELFRNYADLMPFATGYAREVIAEKGVNRDFALENCETSSIGIACKNAGIGTDKHGPSREEMVKVERVQNRETLTGEGYTPYQIGRMVAMSEANPADPEPQCRHGAMQLRKGLSEKTGKDYYGFVCISPDKAEQCPADWWELGPNGQWRKKVAKHG